MDFDSQAWLLIILNLALIFTFSWISLRRWGNNPIDVRLAGRVLAGCQMTSTSPKHLQVKTYLVLRRLIKTENDDDPPYDPSSF